jgi:di/tricarboxylate transporter
VTLDIIFVFTLLAATIVLFIVDKIRMDLVALMVVVALALSGVVSPAQAVAGFGDSLVIMIAALFIVGEGLFRTGIAGAAGTWLLRVGGGNETRLLLFLVPVVAGLSAFMSSTGAVALFIPVVLSMARKSAMNPARLLMPLAFASLIGGMLTLIGTPPNIVASSAMESAGLAPFSFFDFTPIGLVILVVGTAYMVLIARHLLPAGAVRNPANPHPTLAEFAGRYGITDHLHRLRVCPDSALVGQTVAEAGMRTHFEVTLFGIRREALWVSSLLPVLAETRMQAEDVLLVYGSPADIARICAQQHLQSLGFPAGEMIRVRNEFGVAEVLLRAKSAFIGETIKGGRFRERFGLSVIGVKRDQTPVQTAFADSRLGFGDTLLLAGPWSALQALESKRDFVVLETPAEMHDVPAHAQKAPLALAIMVGMLVLMVSGVTSSLSAVLLAALAMVLTGCVTVPEAYRSLNAVSLVLIAGMLPLALAMQKTGALNLLVEGLVSAVGDQGPLMLCAGLFIMTSLFSQFISNTATTVLMAPIAIAAAQQLGVNPAPVMMIVALAASTAFSTPIASPVNTLVLAPGNYRFMDFVKVGVPLQLMCMMIILWLTPVFFPF